MSAPGGDLGQLLDNMSKMSARIVALEKRARRLEGHAVQMSKVAAQVEELSADLIGGQGGGRWPRVWRAMSDDKYVENLRGLGRWVCEVLLTRYPHAGDVIPPCWPMHPAAVEELDVLWWGWHEWTGKTGTAQDASDWHKDSLPGTVERISEFLMSCNSKRMHVSRQGVRRIPDRLKDTDNPDLVMVEVLPRLPAGEWRGQA